MYGVLGPYKVLKTLDFHAWEGPKVLKLHDLGKFRGGHGPLGPPSYPDTEKEHKVGKIEIN